jgi:hypothetical protein
MVVRAEAGGLDLQLLCGQRGQFLEATAPPRLSPISNLRSAEGGTGAIDLAIDVNNEPA